MLLFWLSVYMAEIVITFNPFWHIRKLLYPVLLVLLIASTMLILPLLTDGFKALVIFLALYRLINIIRVMKGRMHKYYLQFVSRRTSLILGLVHLVVFFTLSLILSYVSWQQILVASNIGLFLLLVLLALNTARVLNKLSFYKPTGFLADKHLPTVTVAIPARNETIDLEQCLKSVLKSDYPKLEVLVYDDCSHQKTSQVIKQFAHDGVRFINGELPTKRWLAKNQAYQSLLDHATGELVAFIGVDVRFEPNTLRDLVNTMYHRKKRMLSVLPLRENSTVSSALLQPLRYWWELVPPRKLLSRPPVLSTCWIVDRQFMQSLGGFKSVSHAVLPERYFAAAAVETDAYSFLRSNQELGLKTAKKYVSQLSTEIRVKYPLVRRRLENVLFISSFLMAAISIPLLSLFVGYKEQNWVSVGFSLGSILSVLLIHTMVIMVSDPKVLLKGLLCFPAAIIVNFYAGYMSMFKYEFGSVEWKGRNVCIPAMHVYPKLPELKD